MALTDKARQLIQEQVKDAFDTNISKLINTKFAEAGFNKPLPNKLLTGMKGYESQEKLHGFDDYELRDSKGFDSFRDFLKCIHEKNYTALNNCRPEQKDLLAGEAGGSFLIPTKFQAEIINDMAIKEIVRPLCRNYTIKRGQGESLTIPAVSAYDFSSNVAGLQAYWKGESASYTESQPTIRQLSLKLNKLTILTDLSEELIFASGINTDSLITGLFSDACAFELDNRFILSGTGAGMPLAFGLGNDLISITAESGQTTDTLIAENIGNMLKRLTPGAWNSAVWLCSVDNIMMLLKLGFAVGTSYIPMKAFSESNGKFYLLGRPVIFTQFCGALGEANSIMLANLKGGYATLTRDNMMIRSDEGKGAGFKTDTVSMKLTMYVDGQPINNEVTTLKDGSTTVSNFISVPAI